MLELLDSPDSISKLVQWGLDRFFIQKQIEIEMFLSKFGVADCRL